MARIALDIDSTLHHYWDLFRGIVRERFGVDLPYEEQEGWGITRLPDEFVREAVRESHSDENIASAEPYPDAVETVRAWHEAGHWIHVTSHRAETCQLPTANWLDAIGLPYDDLHCSYDKVSRCIELEIDVLVDDSPINLAAAREAGILGATILHPWNRGLEGAEGIVVAADWSELRGLLEPHLLRLQESAR
ncbi:MAG: 5' nucleotidase, NT5C type [Thermoleophilaceae bacterium]